MVTTRSSNYEHSDNTIAVNMPDNSASGSTSTPQLNSSAGSAVASLKLPNAWLHNLSAWFLYAESQFCIRNITDDTIKYHHVVTALTEDMIGTLTDVLSDPFSHKYDIIKEQILLRMGPREEEQARSNLRPYSIGDTKHPSILLSEVKQSLGQAAPIATVKSFWVARLPPKLRTVAITHSEADLTALARILDAAFRSDIFHLETASGVGTAHTEVSKLDALTAVVGDLVKQVVTLQAGNDNRGRSRRRSSSVGRYSSPRGRSASYDRYHRHKGGNRAFPSSAKHEQRGRSVLCYYHARFGNEARKCSPPCNYGD